MVRREWFCDACGGSIPSGAACVVDFQYTGFGAPPNPHYHEECTPMGASIAGVLGNRLKKVTPRETTLTCPECKSATIEVVAMSPVQAALHCFDCEHEWTAVRDEDEPDSPLERRLRHGEHV